MSEYSTKNIKDTTKSEQGALHLSIQLSERNIIAAVIDLDNQEIKALDEFPVIGSQPENKSYFIGNLLRSNDLFKANIQSVDVAFMGPRSLLIPLALFDEKLKKTYCERFFEWDTKEETILKDFMVSLKSLNLYACPHYISDTIKEFYPAAQFRHFSSSLIEYLLRLNKSQTEKVVYVHLYPERMDVVIIEGYQLVFHNSFENQTAEGWLYYILFVTEQLEINLNQTQFVFLGKVDKDSEEWSLMKSYLPKVALISPTHKLKRSEAVGDFPEHRYYILVNQSQCV